jgi:hypothetical protein
MDFVLVRTISSSALILLWGAQAPIPSVDDLEPMIRLLTSEDPIAFREAQDRLMKLGPDVVPVLFERMVVADWELKPRLMEVLNEHGQAYSVRKMTEGTAEEKIHAAILYELIDWEEKTNSREYRMMEHILLNGIKSDDPYLRTLAAVALVHDEKANNAIDHFYQIVPVLIEGVDAPLYLNRRARFDPFVTPLFGVGTTLDVLIGDRLACSELDERAKDIDEKREDGATPATEQRRQKALLEKNRALLDEVKAYWRNWWSLHCTQNLAGIGTLMIERNLSMLPDREMTWAEYQVAPAERSQAYYSSSKIKHVEIIKGSLNFWTGQDFQYAQEWRVWWKDHRNTYEGPGRPRGDNDDGE